MRVVLKAFTDRTFVFKVKPPPTSWFLKRCAGVMSCADDPGDEVVGVVSVKNIYEIAKIKQEVDPDLESINLRSICKVLP
jgi:large subunit ribosomal protein L11